MKYNVNYVTLTHIQLFYVIHTDDIIVLIYYGCKLKLITVLNIRTQNNNTGIFIFEYL